MEYAEKPEMRTARMQAGDDGGDGTYQYYFSGIPAKGYQQEGYDTDSGTVVTGYLKDVKTVNGLPIKAKYSPSGDLVGFVAPSDYRNWLTGNSSVSGSWDASGKPTPVQYTPSKGFLSGFISDLGSYISDVANISFDVAKEFASDPTVQKMVAAVVGGPPAVAAVSAAQGDSPEDIAKSYIISEGLNQVSAPTTDPNAVGSATGPDNIDVGGGWNPATGATAAELEDARVALEQPPVETVPVETPPPTVEQITSDIAADNIDAGGGWNPATGATEAELAQAKAAMASNGWTLKQALDAVRAGLLVNSITGDPLGLGDSGGGVGSTGQTGFAQVPIPTEWKSPEYSYTPVQNVTFEDLFPGVSLQGTQWQGLQNIQPNMSFNDIFASGMQQTPMGSPVDINQIVSAIVGQNAKI